MYFVAFFTHNIVSAFLHFIFVLWDIFRAPHWVTSDLDRLKTKNIIISYLFFIISVTVKNRTYQNHVKMGNCSSSVPVPIRQFICIPLWYLNNMTVIFQQSFVFKHNSPNTNRLFFFYDNFKVPVTGIIEINTLILICVLKTTTKVFRISPEYHFNSAKTRKPN